MYEFDRQKLLKELITQRKKLGLIASILPEDDNHNVRLLDCIIYTGYYCNHENIITNPKDKKKNCICLDCGLPVAKEGNNYKRIYNTNGKTSLVEIRKRYLKSLITESTRDAIDEMINDKTLKLSKYNV